MCGCGEGDGLVDAEGFISAALMVSRTKLATWGPIRTTRRLPMIMPTLKVLLSTMGTQSVKGPG
jgi:hypothetical protein